MNSDIFGAFDIRDTYPSELDGARLLISRLPHAANAPLCTLDNGVLSDQTITQSDAFEMSTMVDHAPCN